MKGEVFVFSLAKVNFRNGVKEGEVLVMSPQGTEGLAGPGWQCAHWLPWQGGPAALLQG